MYKKTPKDFIPDGTTQHQFTVNVVKNLRRDIQLNAWLQYERWKAPNFRVGQQSDVVVAGQIKFFPTLRTDPTPAKESGGISAPRRAGSIPRPAGLRRRASVAVLFPPPRQRGN